MKELIEIYERKLKNINERIQEFKDDESWNTITEKQRLTMKKMEYKAFLDDLKRVCPPEKEREIPIYITRKTHYCLFKKWDDNSNYYYVRITSDENNKVFWSRGYINGEGNVSLVGGDFNPELFDSLEDEFFEYKKNYD
jgi:hypothetical protein